MSRITTHILDTALGKPAAGVRVRLERRAIAREPDQLGDPIEAVVQVGLMGLEDGEPDRWTVLGDSVTDADGRCRDLAQEAPSGTYRLIFQAGAYFARTARRSIYPEIAIVFDCRGEEHYHLPLLLSDNSYTTYRGS